MASVFHLYCDASNIKQKILKQYSDCATSDKKFFFAAVAIQRTWRGYACRKMIAYWNNQATLIQRYIRGWLVRIHLPEYLKAYYDRMVVRYYNRNATIIQAIWRGFRVRKYVLCVKDIIAERLEREMVSKEMQMLMKEAFRELHARSWNATRQCMEKILMILFDRHHLLRTRTKEGIFSIHGANKLSLIEKILKSFPLTEYMKELRELNQVQDISDDGLKQEKFDLNTNLKKKPYERMMLLED